MTATKRTDRDVWDLPALRVDVAAAVNAARAVVSTETTPEDRARVAGRAIADSETLLVELRARRDQIAYSVTQQWWVRRGANMPGALGMSRVEWKKIRDRQAGSGEPLVADALALLPDAATDVAYEKARLAELTVLRNRAVAELIDLGWTNVAIGELVVRVPSLVSWLRAKSA